MKFMQEFLGGYTSQPTIMVIDRKQTKQTLTNLAQDTFYLMADKRHLLDALQSPLSCPSGLCLGAWYDTNTSTHRKQTGQKIKLSYALNDWLIGIQTQHNSAIRLSNSYQTSNGIALGGTLRYVPQGQTWYTEISTAYDNQPVHLLRSPLTNTETTQADTVIHSHAYSLTAGQMLTNWHWYGSLSHNVIKKTGYQEQGAAFNFDIADSKYQATALTIGIERRHPLSNQWTISAGGKATYDLTQHPISHYASNPYFGSIQNNITPNRNHAIIHASIAYAPTPFAHIRLTPYTGNLGTKNSYWGVAIGIENQF